MMLQGKRITFIGLNYAPEDTAIGLYSTQMVQALSNAGAQVDVITAFPYYPQWKIAENYENKKSFLVEKQENITIYRFKQYVPADPTFAKRVLHIISFTLGSMKNMNRIGNSDLVISVIPFTSSAWTLEVVVRLPYSYGGWYRVLFLLGLPNFCMAGGDFY